MAHLHCMMAIINNLVTIAFSKMNFPMELVVFSNPLFHVILFIQSVPVYFLGAFKK